MTYNRTPKKPTAVALRFQELYDHFPAAALKEASISRSAWNSVCFKLSRRCTFATGTEMRASIVGLADEAGVSEPTVRKVIKYLAQKKVITDGGQERKPGKPTQIWNFSGERIDQLLPATKAARKLETDARSAGRREKDTQRAAKKEAEKSNQVENSEVFDEAECKSQAHSIENSEPFNANLRPIECKSQTHDKDSSESITGDPSSVVPPPSTCLAAVGEATAGENKASDVDSDLVEEASPSDVDSEPVAVDTPSEPVAVDKDDEPYADLYSQVGTLPTAMEPEPEDEPLAMEPERSVSMEPEARTYRVPGMTPEQERRRREAEERALASGDDELALLLGL